MQLLYIMMHIHVIQSYDSMWIYTIFSIWDEKCHVENKSRIKVSIDPEFKVSRQINRLSF